VFYSNYEESSIARQALLVSSELKQNSNRLSVRSSSGMNVDNTVSSVVATCIARWKITQ